MGAQKVENQLIKHIRLQSDQRRDWYSGNPFALINKTILSILK
jgi:hypothetical protein